MYRMENGVLYKEGKPIFCLGQSYYPSYHSQKVPVLETGDRLGEMRKDLQGMKEAGFHLVRMAALGEVRLYGSQVQVQFDLPDQFATACERLDLAAMIRLQGYSMNLRGFEDGSMVDQNGQKMPFHWSWFLRNSLNHPGIYEDNVKGTIASARHFADFPSVVSFQIYNEPAYPTDGLYDYHPRSIERYRKWLEEKGLPACDPPRERPAPGGDAQPWVLWRLFCMERLNAFLCDMGDRAREGYGAPESLTCHMGCPVSPGAVIRGEDYFATAEGMDILGITAYMPHRGPSYHAAGLQLAMSESAAAMFGKHTWLIEYNARTNMPPQEWQRETYAAIGHGLKGILYYQWRADYPFADGPEPEGFGLLFNDGRKTPVYDTAVRMNRMINRLGTEIAVCEKQRTGLAILYSNAQNAYFDAVDNGGILRVPQCHERSILSLRRLYALLSERSVPVDFTRPEDLARNPLSIHTLLLPMHTGLPDEALDAVDAFVAAGGRAFVFQDDVLGFVPYARRMPSFAHGIVHTQYDVDTLLTVVDVAPPAAVVGAPCVDARMLRSDTHAICCLINYDPLERPMERAALRIPGLAYKSAVAYAPDLPEEGLALPLHGDDIELPKLSYGAIILLTGGVSA